MMDPAMQQAMAGMAGQAPAGDAGPSDQDLLMLILELIASGQLSGPGVDVLSQAVGASAPGGMAGGAPMGAPSGAPPAGGTIPPGM
jgi:hypothetical protein